MPFVYAVVHNGMGDFLMFRKNVDGYFFHSAGGGGTIYPAGQPIVNGPGDYAFPGGTPDDQSTPIAGAQEELLDETGLVIHNPYCSPNAYNGVDGPRNYVGVYFDVNGDLDQLEQDAYNNLFMARQAAHAAPGYTADEYDELLNNYPGCPADNELDYYCETWNVFDNWDQIHALNAPPTDWFYNIIVNLRDSLFPVQVIDHNRNIVGRAQTFAVLPNGQYVLNIIRFDPVRLDTVSIYTVVDGTDRYVQLKLEQMPVQHGTAIFSNYDV